MAAHGVQDVLIAARLFVCGLNPGFEQSIGPDIHEQGIAEGADATAHVVFRVAIVVIALSLCRIVHGLAIHIVSKQDDSILPVRRFAAQVAIMEVRKTLTTHLECQRQEFEHGQPKIS
jgi:hypothetical protein